MSEPAGGVPPPTSGDGEGRTDAAWKAVAGNLLDALALNATILFSRPTLTMGVFMPAAYMSGRFGIVSTPLGCLLCAGLIGLAYLSDKRHKRSVLERERSFEFADSAGFSMPLPLWGDPADGKDGVRRRAESVEWLNQFVRHCWLRYPKWVGDWLIRDIILGEILEGLKRDKVLPAGPIKDIQCTKIILRDAAPWVMEAEVCPTRSLDEIQLIAQVRFVSDKDTGVEIKIIGPAGVVVPVKIEQISFEGRLSLRLYLTEEPPFIRVIWLSMVEKPKLDLAILPMGGIDVMHIPGLDTMIHNIIMQGIQQEIVLPAGKIIAIKKGMPDEYYKEWGPAPTPLDSFQGELILMVRETRMMLHPAFREQASQDLYIKVALDGQQVQRSCKIRNTMSEKCNLRFHLFVPTEQAEGGSRIQMQLVCEEAEKQHKPVPLGSIALDAVVQRSSFQEPTWLDVAALTNGRLEVCCIYTAFQPSFKTIKSQYSNMKEFCGGTCDWRGANALPSEVLSTASEFAQLRAHTKLGTPRAQRGAAPGAPALVKPPSMTEKAQEALTPNWHDMLTRRQYKEVLWVTVHSATSLISKMIGTRDPYIRLVLGDQVEKTSAKINNCNPKFEETFCFFLGDTAINDELTVTAHQDDVSRGYHVVDDAIGTYAFSMRQLKTAANGAWTGTVALKKVRSGKVTLTMSLSPLADTVVDGKQREGSGLSDVEICGGSGIAQPIRMLEPVKTVEAVLQLKILRARCEVYDSKTKAFDKIPHPYLKVAVGSGKTWQNCDTRVVRSTKTPEFNEYLEFVVRDVGKETVVFSFESRDGFFTDILATLRLPLTAVARGECLQKWLPFKVNNIFLVNNNFMVP